MKMPKLKSYKVLIIIIFVILGIFILFMTTEKTRTLRALEKNLYKRYGEEFNISALYKRKSNSGIRYQAEYIYPKSYDGTLKEYDSYYWGKGFVRVENFGLKLIAGDTYGGVLLNESANNFYLPKLKELFGENILPILNIKGAYEYTDFQKEYLRAKKTISGGIYIFGQVESDEDREWYRKQIYEFVQFMKQTGTFEYVELDIMIIDERVLTKEFRENIFQTQEKLSSNPKTRADIGKRKERRSIMNELNEYFDFNKNYSEIINSYNKGSILENGSSEIAKNASLLYLRVYSPKLIHSKGWNKSNDPELYEEIKEYNTIADVEFEWEAW